MIMYFLFLSLYQFQLQRFLSLPDTHTQTHTHTQTNKHTYLKEMKYYIIQKSF